MYISILLLLKYLMGFLTDLLRIRSYSGPYFPAFGKIWDCRMRENTNARKYGPEQLWVGTIFKQSLVLANKTKKTISHLHKFSVFFYKCRSTIWPISGQVPFLCPQKMFSGGIEMENWPVIGLNSPTLFLFKTNKINQ